MRASHLCAYQHVDNGIVPQGKKNVVSHHSHIMWRTLLFIQPSPCRIVLQGKKSVASHHSHVMWGILIQLTMLWCFQNTIRSSSYRLPSIRKRNYQNKKNIIKKLWLINQGLSIIYSLGKIDFRYSFANNLLYLIEYLFDKLSSL